MNPSPVCRSLRNKSMYVPALAQETPAQHPGEVTAPSSHCWCNCTLTETGPDDKPVGPQVCRAPRPCFEE